MNSKRSAGYGIFLMLLMILGSCKAQDDNKIYGLGNCIYSADIDKWTESLKEDQRANAKEFFSLLDEAIRNGTREITLKKENYRFNSSYLGRKGQAFIQLRNVENFTINGNGAQFWFENYIAGLSVDNCKNITFKDLTMDWDPLPFSQVVVTSVDSVSIEGDTESGFRNMSDILKDPDVRKPVLKIFFFDSKTGLIKPDVAHSEVDSIKELGTRHLKFYGHGYGGYKYNRQNIRPGDRMAIVMRLTHGVRVRKSEDIRFVKFNLYSSPMFGITMGDGGGGLVLLDSKITPRPGTKRLMGINGDGVHLTSLNKGPLIEGCEFSAAGDDIMNIHGDFGMVQEQLNPKRIVVALKNYRNISEGKFINLYDSETFEHKGSFKVTAITEADQKSKEDARRIGKEKRVKFWPGNGSIICELDKPVTVSRYDVVESLEDIGSGAIIRNNYLHNLTTRGFLIQTKNALVENNTFLHVDNAAIAIMASTEWCESPFPENITLRNNIIRDANIGLGSRYADHAKIGAISVNLEYEGELKENARPIGGIVIENNKIYNSATAGIFMLHTHNSKIEKNLIDGFCIVDQLKVGRSKGIEPYSGIFIGDSKEIEITGNTIINGGKYATGNIIIGKYADKNSIRIGN
jgi:hypothetical protein